MSKTSSTSEGPGWAEALVMIVIQAIVPAILNWSIRFAPDSILLAPLCCAAMLPCLLAPKTRVWRFLSRFAYLAFVSLFVFDFVALYVSFSSAKVLLHFTLAVLPTLLFGYLVFRDRS